VTVVRLGDLLFHGPEFAALALYVGMLVVVDLATHVVFAIGTGAAGAEQRVFGVPVAAETRFIDPVTHRRPHGRLACIHNP